MAVANVPCHRVGVTGPLVVASEDFVGLSTPWVAGGVGVMSEADDFQAQSIIFGDEEAVTIENPTLSSCAFSEGKPFDLPSSSGQGCEYLYCLFIGRVYGFD